MTESLFDTSSWFYQCTCFAFGTEEEQTVQESGLSVLDEHGQPIDDDKASVASPTGTGVPEEGQESKEELLASDSAIRDGSTIAVAAAAAAATTGDGTAVAKSAQQPAASVKSTSAGKHPPARQTSRPRSSEVSVNLKTFTEDLKVGIPFKKHCRDGSIRKRTLILDESKTKLGWKEHQNPNTMIRLADVLEIRNATQLDPSTVGDPDHPQGMGGTATLRRTVDGTSARRAFSFILNGRTLDIEMPTEIEARKLSASFRLLVQKIKNEASGAR